MSWWLLLRYLSIVLFTAVYFPAVFTLLSVIDPQETEISTSNVTNITSGMNLNTTNVTVSSNASDLF